MADATPVVSKTATIDAMSMANGVKPAMTSIYFFSFHVEKSSTALMANMAKNIAHKNQWLAVFFHTVPHEDSNSTPNRAAAPTKRRISDAAPQCFKVLPAIHVRDAASEKKSVCQNKCDAPPTMARTAIVHTHEYATTA